MIYSHRNGERTPPTELGWYWLQDDQNYTVPIWYMLEIADSLYVWIEGIDHDRHYVTWGRWWGPISRPDDAEAES